MASCTRIDGWLQAYLDDELGLSERVIVEQHLAECPSCSNVYRRQQRTSALLFETLTAQRSTQDFASAVMDHLPEMDRPMLDDEEVVQVNLRAKHAAGILWRTRVERTVPLAIGLLLIVGALFLRHNWPAPPPGMHAVGMITGVDGAASRFTNDGDIVQQVQTAEYVDKGDTVETGKGARMVVALNGPTTVKLNESTRLRVDNHRLLRLDKGQIWLDVADDDQRLFKIETPTGVITVFGTRFDVSVRAGLTRVVVEEGEVFVEHSDAFQTVAAGYSVEVENDVDVITPRRAQVAQDTAWAHAIGVNEEAKLRFDRQFETEAPVVQFDQIQRFVFPDTGGVHIKGLVVTWTPDQYKLGDHCGYTVYVIDDKSEPIHRQSIPGVVFENKTRSSYELSLTEFDPNSDSLMVQVVPDYTYGTRLTQVDVKALVTGARNGVRVIE